MKNKLLIPVVILLSIITTQAQSVKIGHTNAEYLVTQMPQYASIQKEVEEYSAQLNKQLQSKIQDYQIKLQDLRANMEKMVPEVLNDEQQELQNMEQSIRKFEMEMQQSIRRKQVQKLQPIYEKIEKAIKDVATENGYTHVFSDGRGSASILLYAREQDDISNLILKKMGITPKETTASGN